MFVSSTVRADSVNYERHGPKNTETSDETIPASDPSKTSKKCRPGVSLHQQPERLTPSSLHTIVAEVETR